MTQGSIAAFCTPPVWPLLDQAIADQRDYYYGDHGWFKRGKYYRVAKNAVQYQPTLDDLQRARPFRYDLHGYDTAADWQRDGTAIIICPNSPVYMRRFGLDAHAWTLEMADRLGRITRRPIIIRWKDHANVRPLYLDLHTAYCVVVFSSGAAVEALRAGIPIITTADWATTRMMGVGSVEDIDQLIYPENEQRIRFLWALAEKQWTMAEISAGVAWKALHAG